MTTASTDSTGSPAALDLEDLRTTIAGVLDLDTEELTDDAVFSEDLGIDSLMALEVVVALEKKYQLRFVEAELRQVTSLRQAYETVRGKLGPA
ncbi:acyl carrier protein [Streptomyces sp. NBRC 109706]|uniref:acyl carrier protein n=1 Tax=Streptomyces sp. NBRC 109706 TaxID=1550035 RepID=UPI000780B1C4|nr:acyl carrier protein [Streptomyces sp. NBRC 109706]